MPKFNLLAGVLALGLFSYSQYQGWNLFDSVANPGGGTGSSGSRGSSMIYHK